MKKHQLQAQALRTVREQWECAVECAAQTVTREHELSPVAFQRARGIHIRSGLNAGEGSAALGSYGYGSYSIATYPVVADDVSSYGSYGVWSTAQLT